MPRVAFQQVTKKIETMMTLDKTKTIDLKHYRQTFKPVVTKLRPAKIFYPAHRVFLKNIYHHFEPQLDRIMSEIPQFQFLYFLREHTKILGKNSKVRDQIKGKNFFVFFGGRKIAIDLCSEASRVAIFNFVAIEL